MRRVSESDAWFMPMLAVILVAVAAALAGIIMGVWNWAILPLFDNANYMEYWQAVIITAVLTIWTAIWKAI